MSEHISTSSDKAALDKNPNHKSMSRQIRKVFERYNPMYLKERAVLDTLCESAQDIMLPADFFDRISHSYDDGSLIGIKIETGKACRSTETLEFTDNMDGFVKYCRTGSASLADVMEYTLTLAHCAPETVKYLDAYWSDLFKKSDWPTREITEELRGDCRTWFAEHEQEVAVLLRESLIEMVANIDELDEYGTDILVNGADRRADILLGDVEESIESLPFSEACRDHLLKEVRTEILNRLNDNEKHNFWRKSLEGELWRKISWGEQGGGLLLEHDTRSNYKDIIQGLTEKRQVLPKDWEGNEDFEQYIARLQQCGMAVEALDEIANSQPEDIGIRLKKPDHQPPKRSDAIPNGQDGDAEFARKYEDSMFSYTDSLEDLRCILGGGISSHCDEYAKGRFSDAVRAANDPWAVADWLVNENKDDIRIVDDPLYLLRTTVRTLLSKESDDLVEKLGLEKEVGNLRQYNQDIYNQLGEERYRQLSDDSLTAEIACRMIGDICGDDYELYDAIMARATAWAYNRIHEQGFSIPGLRDHLVVFVNRTDKVKFPIDLPDGEAVLRAISPDRPAFNRYMQMQS